MTEPASTASSSDAGASRKPSRFAWWLSTALLAFSGGMIANPWFETQVRSRLPASLQPSAASGTGTAEMAAQMAVLQNRLTAVEARPGAALPGDVAGRIAALEASGTAGPASAAADIAPLDQRLAAVEGRIATAESSAQSASQAAQSLQSAIVGLDSRVASAQAKADRDGVTLRAMAAALALRPTIEQGRPLGQLDDTVALLLGANTPDMLTLRRIERGGPTLPSLRSSFARLRPLLMGDPGDTNTSLLDSALGSLRALVVVKSADARNPAGRTPDVLLPLVDTRLGNGDVAGAVAAVQLLAKPARDRANSWTTQAEAYVATRAALTRIEAQTIDAATRIAAAPPPLGVVTVVPTPVVAPPAAAGGGR